MARVKRGNVARKRRKTVLKISNGFRGTHSRLFRVANQQVMKALRYSYIGRKRRKRDFRQLWILRLNAAIKYRGLNYSLLIKRLKELKIGLNRKTLAQMSIIDEPTFQHLISTIK